MSVGTSTTNPTATARTERPAHVRPVRNSARPMPRHRVFVVRTFETSLAHRPSYIFHFGSPVSSWFQRPRL